MYRFSVGYVLLFKFRPWLFVLFDLQPSCLTVFVNRSSNVFHLDKPEAGWHHRIKLNCMQSLLFLMQSHCLRILYVPDRWVRDKPVWSTLWGCGCCHEEHCHPLKFEPTSLRNGASRVPAIPFDLFYSCDVKDLAAVTLPLLQQLCSQRSGYPYFYLITSCDVRELFTVSILTTSLLQPKSRRPNCSILFLLRLWRQRFI